MAIKATRAPAVPRGAKGPSSFRGVWGRGGVKVLPALMKGFYEDFVRDAFKALTAIAQHCLVCPKIHRPSTHTRKFRYSRYICLINLHFDPARESFSGGRACWLGPALSAVECGVELPPRGERALVQSTRVKASSRQDGGASRPRS